MISLHDVPGNLKAWVNVGAYSAAKQEVLMVAPYALLLKTAKVYFGGTPSVANATMILYSGITAIGTAATSGTVAFKTPVTIFTGSLAVAAGALLSLGCAVGSGTVPPSMVEFAFQGG
jgi:hypothetical protein